MTARTFAAMGTDALVVVVGGRSDHATLLDRAARAIARYERRWSRFVPDSELGRLNRAAGRPVVLADDTFAVVARAVEAWAASDGRFDPTVLDALEHAGYHRSFPAPARLGALPPTPWAGPVPAVPGAGGVVLDHGLRAVVLPPGTRLDLGGIAKGWAADAVSADLVEQGASGALVSLGGDLRALGQAPPGGWTVAVEDPRDPAAPPLAVLDAGRGGGGVATSSRTRRRWAAVDAAGRPEEAHHLVEPRTGRPARTDLLAATAVAATATDAEVLAKVAVLAGARSAPGLLARAGATGLLVTDAGAVHLPGLALAAQPSARASRTRAWTARRPCSWRGESTPDS